MPRPPSQLTMRYNRARLLIYRTLLAEPTSQWTVRALVAQIPPRAGVSVSTVRAVLYVLADDQIVDRVPFRTALTVVLTDHGAAVLRRAIAFWLRSGESCQ